MQAESSSLEDAKQAFREMLGAVAQYKAKTILFDGRNVKAKPQELERFCYGAFAAEETLRLVKEHGIAPRFAYVMHKPLRDPERFWGNRCCKSRDGCQDL